MVNVNHGAEHAIDAGCISIDQVRAASELAMKENRIVWFTIDDDSVNPETVAGVIEGRLTATGEPTSKTE